MKDKIKIGLVLGGGAALGFAHAGVIEVLEKNGIVPNIIVGTSMGALVGGLYAAGYTVPQMVEFAKEIKIMQLLDTNIMRFKKRGLISGKNINDKLIAILGDKKIEDLNIKYIAVAADLISKKEVHIKKGSVVKAIRASISIPVVFEPLVDGKRMLVDGGIIKKVCGAK